MIYIYHGTRLIETGSLTVAFGGTTIEVLQLKHTIKHLQFRKQPSLLVSKSIENVKNILKGILQSFFTF